VNTRTNKTRQQKDPIIETTQDNTNPNKTIRQEADSTPQRHTSQDTHHKTRKDKTTRQDKARQH
jgi:hypothetical protein